MLVMKFLTHFLVEYIDEWKASKKFIVCGQLRTGRSENYDLFLDETQVKSAFECIIELGKVD